MKKTLAILILCGFVFCAPAQNCNRLAKRSIKNLEPFRFNGSLNKVLLSRGESAELSLILRGGKKYRILVDGGSVMGALSFKIYDRHQTLVFDNSKHDMAQYWDFSIGATQEYHIVVTYPISDKGYSDITTRGCVALAVGFLDNNP